MDDLVLLIDGHGLAYRAYYALPELTGPDGTPTNVLVGVANTLIKVLEEWQPRKVAVVFDEHAPTFRHEKYEAYKETRKPMPEDMRPQIPLLRELLGNLGICVLSKPGMEADDILAATARYWADKGVTVLMLTADKDMLQILRPGVRILRPQKGMGSFVLMDHENFRKDYPFAPEAMADYLALVGDSSDNVPGVPGIGDKGARDLLGQYGTLQEIYRHLEEIKPGVRKKLENGRESALLSKELVELCLDHPGEEKDFQNCRLNKDALEELCLRLGMEQTYRKIGVLHGKSGGSEGVSSGREAFKGEEVSLEDFFTDSLIVLTRDFEDSQGFLLGEVSGKMVREKENPELFWNKLQAWMDGGGTVITSHYKKLCRHLPQKVPKPEHVWDLEVGYYLLHPDRAQKDFPALFEDAEAPSLGEIWQHYSGLEEEVRKVGLDAVMAEIDLPLCPVLVEMENRGVRLARDIMEGLDSDLGVRIEEIQEAVEKAGGIELNLNSPKQVSHLLFDVLGLPVVKKTKTGYSTNTAVLEVLSGYPGGEIPQMLLEYRELSKMQSGFVHPFLELENPETHTIHTTFEHISTGTGRLSSTHPNLQNLPLYGDWARRFRKALGPVQDSRCYISGDYSQIELRILAHLSQEKSLIEAFQEGRDVHTETGARIFEVPSEEVTSEMRRRAKMVNFGLLYGMGSFGLADRLNIERYEAQRLVDTYFAAFPGIKAYLEDSATEAKKRGYTKTLFGRRRPLSEVTTVEGRGGGAIKRVAINTPIQGTAADIARLALIRWHRKNKEEKLAMPLVLQVHDSLVIEVGKEKASWGADLLKTSMESVASLEVPLEVSCKVGTNLEEI